MATWDPDILASFHRNEIRTLIQQKKYTIHLKGFLVPQTKASRIYAEYTQSSCQSVGIHFDLVQTTPDKISDLIQASNLDPTVHGLFVYYPIFNNEQDHHVKDLIHPHKDVEGLTTYWMEKLYKNERFDDALQQHKCILPCTPLAILKLLERTSLRSEFGLPFSEQHITIFNRSTVVGKPLAFMLSNDGAYVYSFDLNSLLVLGPQNQILYDSTQPHFEKSPYSISRAEALQRASAVITGVPNTFKKIQASEIRPEAVCLNFSDHQNFEDLAKEKATIYIPRVGPMTIAMCLRNAVRLFENYHLSSNVSHDSR